MTIPPPMNARTNIADLADGATVDQPFLLAEKSLRANRNGQLYLLSKLRDATGQVTGLMWNVGEQDFAGLAPGDLVHARGKVQMFQGALQVILTRLSAAGTGLDPNDFRPQPSPATEQQFAFLRALMTTLPDADLRALMAKFFADGPLCEAFRACPAGIKAHHAERGGLCAHVSNMAEVWRRIADRYPGVDSSLVLAGVFLHDLGKVRELDADSFTYTDEGQLVGHMPIALELLGDKLREFGADSGTPFPKAKADHLRHLILSHHGTNEMGSSRVPMSVEAVALHYLDSLDAKIDEFQRLIREDPNTDGNFTPYHPRLERKVYKGEES